MNMFKPVGAKSVDEYMAMLSDERRIMLQTLTDTIIEAAPQLELHFASNMLGFGSFKYLNYKKVELDWPVIAIASQKNYVSLYVCAVSDGEYLAEKHKDKLGNVNIGRSCIRIKKLEDINLEFLPILIKEAAENPGLVHAS